MRILNRCAGFDSITHALAISRSPYRRGSEWNLNEQNSCRKLSISGSSILLQKMRDPELLQRW
jgi:hypothetical protein